MLYAGQCTKKPPSLEKEEKGFNKICKKAGEKRDNATLESQLSPPPLPPSRKRRKSTQEYEKGRDSERCHGVTRSRAVTLVSHIFI